MIRRRLLHTVFALLSTASSVFAQSVINPADYGNVTLHLKAEDLQLADSAAVTAWGPLTSAGTNAPRFTAASAAFNGRPSVRFDGTTDYMAKAAANLPAQTVFAVVTLETGAPALAGLLSDGADGLNIRRSDSGLFYNGQARGNDDDFSVSAPAGRLLVNGSPSAPYSAGVAHLVFAEAGDKKTFPDFRLGHSGNSLPRYWRGSIAEVILYDGRLTEAGLNRVGWHLQDKYKLPTNFPAPVPEIQKFTATAAGPVTSARGVVSAPGAPVTLSWQVRDALTVSISQDVLAATAEQAGTVTVSPAATTTYTLTAVNALGPSAHSVTVHIGAVPLPPQLTEFAAQNEAGPADEDGALSDWIEIYNPNPYAIDLQGWRLKDSGAEWDFPAGSGIEAEGFRLIFASGKNRVNPAANLHTGFALSADGEYLGLVRSADGAAVSEFAPQYPAQRAGRSYGVHGSPPQAGYFAAPTPGAANAVPGGLGFLDDIGFLKAAAGRGFYTAAVTENITAQTPGAILIYTTNGSTPSLTNGTRITPPDAAALPVLALAIHPGAVPEGAPGTNLASIGGVSTLRILLVKEGYAPSRIQTHTYLFSAQILGQTAADARAKGWPSAASVNGQLLNYGMDPAAVAAFPPEEMLQSLHSLPALSIVTDSASLTGAAAGIYVNALQHGDEWERPVSAELILPPGYVDPDGNKTGFQINAGLRIRGGYSRNDEFYKHGLRLYFSKKYEGKLKFPLFGGEGTDEFGKLDFGTGSNYGWFRESSYSSGKFNTMCRDMFCRDTQGALGQPYTKSRFYHLYLNGHYWGVYYSEERAEAEFAASYMGGDDSEYDSVKCGNHISGFQTEATDGSLEAWRVLWDKVRAIGNRDTSNAAYFEIQGRNPDGTRNPAMPILLDVDNLIDEMLVIFYAGDGDAVLSGFLGHNQPNNWLSVYRRDGAHGFRFFIRDAEHTLGAPSWVANQTGPWNGSNKTNFAFSNPQWMHEDLMKNAEYKLRFADHVQRHFFNSGALTPAQCIARFQRRADQVEKAMKAESARWGDVQSISGLPAGHPRRYIPADWTAAITTVKNTVMPNRTATVLGQLKTDGLYPAVAAAVFMNQASGEAQHGGTVEPGFQLGMTAAAGAVYYTMDGSDPRAFSSGPAAGAVLYSTPLTLNAGTQVQARVLSDGKWSALTAAYFNAGAMPATAANLTVSQLHYHPAGGNDFEYIEFMNIGAQAIDLTGVHLREGIDFDFPAGTVLAAGGRLQVVSNPALFATLYTGAGLRVTGAYTGNLSNSGERLLVVSDTQGVIRDFSYLDEAPWPAAADGDGFALVLINPSGNPAAGDAANWRASTAVNGTPGQGESGGGGPVFTGNPAADADGDGLTALLEYALGTSDAEARSGAGTFAGALESVTVNGAAADYLTFTVTQPALTESVVNTVEITDSLGLWQSGPDKVLLLREEPAEAAGMMRRTWRAAAPYSAAARQFMRLRVQLK